MRLPQRRLCREAVVWKRISHPNILPFIGVTLTNEIAVVSQWAENGSVLKYLKDPPEDHEPNPVKLVRRAKTVRISCLTLAAVAREYPRLETSPR